MEYHTSIFLANIVYSNGDATFCKVSGDPKKIPLGGARGGGGWGGGCHDPRQLKKNRGGGCPYNYYIVG